MIHKIKHHSKRIIIHVINRIKGFTLIELLIVIAILGIVAAAILVAINPGKRMAQARDAQRKQDMNAITNALTGYYTIIQEYPTFETTCDTSRGRAGGGSTTDCSTAVTGSNLGTCTSSAICTQLVTNQGFLKQLPIDPKNDQVYYYQYEPGFDSSSAYCTSTSGNRCMWYWVGARLEAVDDPSKAGKIVFRCSDNTSLALGAGCKEVEFPSASSTNSFDVSSGNNALY